MLIELSNFTKIELKLTVLSRYSCPSDINSRILGFTPGIQAWCSRQFFPNPSREGSRFHYSTLLYKSLLRPLLYVKGIQDENEAPWCCVALIPLIPFTSRSQLNQVRAYCLSSPPYARRTPLTGPVLALILYLSDLLALRTLGTSPIMKRLQDDSCPCWFRKRFESEKSIIAGIHTVFQKLIPSLWKDSPRLGITNIGNLPHLQI